MMNSDPRLLARRLRGAWLRSPYGRKELAWLLDVPVETLLAWLGGVARPTADQMEIVEQFISLYPLSLHRCVHRSLMRLHH